MGEIFLIIPCVEGVGKNEITIKFSKFALFIQDLIAFEVTKIFK